MVNIKYLTALILGFVICTTAPANAGDLVHAGDPSPANLSTDTADYADIYQRQLAYREEANKFRELIYERQRDFKAPAKAAREQYAQSLDSIKESRTSKKP